MDGSRRGTLNDVLVANLSNANFNDKPNVINE